MKTILCFGDSNTHGSMPMHDFAVRRRLGVDKRWPGILQARLGPSWRVVEEGHPGRTTVHPDPIEGDFKNGLPALHVALETHWPVDLAVLMLGTNDLKARFSVTAEDIALSVEKLVLTIRAIAAVRNAEETGILVIAPPPIIESGCLAGMFLGGQAKSMRLSGLYREVAQRQSCRFLDAGAHIVSSPVDGIHFDKEAHAILGNRVADAIGDKMN